MSVHTTKTSVQEQPRLSDRKREQALQISASIPLKSKSLLEKIILTSSLLNRELMLRGNNREVRLANTILTSAWNLWNEMSNIIDIATFETEGLNLHFQPVAVNSVIHDVLEQILPKLQSYQQILTLKLSPKSPEVMADKLRLEQILLAILSNVSQNTGKHGSIHISTTEQKKTAAIRIWGEPAVAGSVTGDTPCGQTEHNGDSLASGLTIELALCKYLTKAHKGKLWLPGEITAGNAFVIALPSIDN